MKLTLSVYMKIFAKKNIEIYIIVFLGILCLLPLIHLVYAKDGVKFLLYLIIYIYLPGRMLYKRVFRLDFDLLLRLLTCFYLGVFLIILLYYISYFMHALILIKVLPVLFATVEIGCFLKRKEYHVNIAKKVLDNSNQIICFEIILLIHIISCMLLTNFSFPYQDSAIYSDRTFQMSHIAGLATPMPFTSMTVYGSELKYHIFYYIFLACSKIIFSYDAYMVFNRFIVTHVPILMSIALLKVFYVNSKRMSVVLYFSLITIFSLLSYKYQYYFIHVMSSHNAVGFAVPLLITICFITMNYFNDNKCNKNLLCLCSLFTILLTGIKGPAGLLYASATLFYIVLFNRNKKNLFLAIFVVISFVLSYYFLLYSGNGNTFYNNGSVLGNVSLFFLNGYFDSLNSQIFKLILKLLFWPINLLVHFNIFAIPIFYYAILTVYNLFTKKRNGYEYYIIMTCAGVFAGFIIAVNGNSNYYFLMMIFPFIGMLSLLFVNDFDLLNFRCVRALLIFVLIAMLPFAAKNICSAKNSNEQKGFIASIENIVDYFNPNQHTVNEIFDAYNYVKANIPIEAIIATNKTFQDGNYDDHRQHYLAAYGERHVYLEGYQYSGVNLGYSELDTNIINNRLLFSKASEIDKLRLLKDLEIDYVFFYKGINGSSFNESYDRFEPIFNNDKVTIFKIIK